MKAWFKSKTMWVNFAAVVLGGIANMLETAPIDPQYQVLVLGAINLVLRVVTTQPIGAADSA